MVPMIPTLTDVDERHQAVTEVQTLVVDGKALGTGAEVVDPLFLPADIRVKYMNRVADGYRVPIARTPNKGLYFDLRFSSGEYIHDSLTPGSKHAHTGKLCTTCLGEMSDDVVQVGVPAATGAAALTLVTDMAAGSIAGAATLLMGAAGVIAYRARARRKDRREGYESGARYGFSPDELALIRDSAIKVSKSAAEVKLAAIAHQCATTITESVAWSDPILDDHRLTFDPDAEASEIRQHALRVAALRVKLSASADAASDVTVIAANKDVDVLYESLRDRVAALWVYARKIEELSAPIRELQAVRVAIEALPAIDDVARQLGVDELATRRLRELSADAGTIASSVNALAADLTKTLMPAVGATGTLAARTPQPDA